MWESSNSGTLAQFLFLTLGFSAFASYFLRSFCKKQFFFGISMIKLLTDSNSEIQISKQLVTDCLVPGWG